MSSPDGPMVPELGQANDQRYCDIEAMRRRDDAAFQHLLQTVDHTDALIGCLNILQYKLTSEQMMEVLDEVERFPNGGTH